MNEIINTNKGIRDGTDMIFDNKSNNGNDLSLDTILLSNLTVYENTEWKEENINGRIKKLPLQWVSKFNKDIFINSGEGGDIKKENYSPEKKEKFIYPIYANSIFNKGLYGYSDIFKIQGECLTITSRGNMGDSFYRNEKFTPIGRLIYLKSKNNLKLLNYLINFYKIKGENGGIPSLTIPMFNKIKNVIPLSLSEQNKIRELLIKQDNIIENIDKRIEKTKKIIKYYHQELLSGRLRLKEVETINGKEIVVYENTEWKEEKLNSRKVIIPKDWLIENAFNCFDLKRGRVISKEYMNINKGAYPVFLSATLNNGCIGYINTYDFDLECVTWTTDGYAGKLNYRKGKFNLTNICGIMLPKKNINLYLFTKIAQKDVYLLRATTYSNSKVMSSHIETLKFVLPNTLNEQDLISDFLTKLDDNLELLLKTKEKEEKTFKFLQQEFLSGKLRLK